MLEQNAPESLGTETLTTPSDAEIVPITLEVLIGDGYHLFQQHCEELEDKAAAIDLERYEILQQQRTLLCMGVYVSNTLVGYSTTVLHRHGHHDTLIASSDSLYVDPNFRRGLGLQLIRQTEKHAQECGVDCMIWAAKPGSALDLILAARRNSDLYEHHYRVTFHGQHNQ